ncbi:MAG: phosphopantetheine-binding protein [Planctomycetota bacterium]|nr:phosphopantetheine-binding protein [Planctomycetota bacterium]MDA1105900.1 phosphopantetheine-binding protein [Planctomycetota bacterium]
MNHALTHDQIFDSVREILCDALGVDEDDVTPAASLTKDLGAESIDFLDINFKIEKKFSTPEKAFKINQGELFPENLTSDASLVKDGKFTDAGMELLRTKMPHVDYSAFDADRSVDNVSELFTVKSLCDFVARKLAA